MLSFHAIEKSFPGVRALSGVSFSIRAGSVHALLGENGAGKSTLLKILSGAQTADSGDVSLDGKPVRFSSPREALDSGVAVIYQELHLVPELSVAENIWLGHLPQTRGIVDRKTLRRETLVALARVGLDVAPETRLGTLSLAQRQMVEIAKALSRDATVIAFDEPTSSLSSRETETLFELIGKLRDSGHAILYVSHRMDEIRRVCDAATVLRDGAHVETFETLAEIDTGVLVSRMVGREIDDIFGYRPRRIGDILLSHRGLTVRAGEIVSVFGLIGAGRTELLREIYADPRDAIKRGICLCPEDRKFDGIVPVASVADNINLSVRRKFARFGAILDRRAEAENARRQIDAMRIKTPSAAQPIGLLSGGNQQKAILGRALSESPKILLLDEPTRGVDIGAKREIYDILYNLADSGVGIVAVTSELPEALGIADRVRVMRDGELVADLSRADATPEACLAFAMPTEGKREKGKG